jgi:hypothetical protein
MHKSFQRSELSARRVEQDSADKKTRGPNNDRRVYGKRSRVRGQRIALTNQGDYLTVTVPNSLTTPPHGEKPPVFELPYETMPVMMGPTPL